MSLFLASTNILEAYKTADESVTNSTTLQNDDHLSVSVVASTKYRLRCFIFHTSLSTTAGIKLALSGTATITSMKAQISIFDDTTNVISGLARVSSLGSSVGAGLGAGDNFVTIEGTVEINAAGTFLVQWAQNVADAVNASTVQQGSYLELEKVG